MKKGILSVLAIMLALTMSGCVQKVLGPVVQGAYDVCGKVENVAMNSDAEEFVKVSKEVKVPLEIVKSAVDYILTKVEKENIVDALEKTSEVLAKVTLVLDNVTIENVEGSKATVIGAVATAKVAIKATADHIGYELTVKTLTVGVDPVADLQASANDLMKMLTDEGVTPVGKR